MGGPRLGLHINRRLYKAFRAQRDHSKARGILFLLNYDEWLTIWLASGHLNERGRKSHQYCMARNGDIGAYTIGNVTIKTNHENGIEGSTGRRHSDAVKWRIGSGNRGKPSPLRGTKRPQHICDKMSRGMKGKNKRPHTEAEKQHLSRVLKGRKYGPRGPLSAEWRAKISQGVKRAVAEKRQMEA